MTQSPRRSSDCGAELLPPVFWWLAVRPEPPTQTINSGLPEVGCLSGTLGERPPDRARNNSEKTLGTWPTIDHIIAYSIAHPKNSQTAGVLSRDMLAELALTFRLSSALGSKGKLLSNRRRWHRQSLL